MAAVAAAGAWLDIRYRRLPNWLCAVALAGAIAFVVAQSGWSELQTTLLHGLVALVVGIGLFAIGAIGAGDAKYYAALAAWFPLRDAPLLIGVVSLAGLFLLAVWFPWRRRHRLRHRNGSLTEPESLFDKLPYGVAIAVGALATFVLTH